MDLSTVRVPGAVTTAVMISMIISILLPVGLIIFWSVKTKARFKNALWGAGTFIVFAYILESLMHQIMLRFMGQEAFTALPFYAIYGGLAAGIFEECGRYIVMRFILQKNLDKKDSIMLGIGHGGVESILLVGIAYISNLVIISTINSGNGNLLMTGLDETLQAQLVAQISPLWTTSAATFLIAGFERIFAIAVHICLSYMVYRSVVNSKPILLVVAIAAHAILDGVTVTVMQLSGSWVATEVFLVVFAVIFVVYTVITYRKDLETAKESEVLTGDQV